MKQLEIFISSFFIKILNFWPQLTKLTLRDLYSFFSRLVCSTNRKDIGTLYIIFTGMDVPTEINLNLKLEFILIIFLIIILSFIVIRSLYSGEFTIFNKIFFIANILSFFIIYLGYKRCFNSITITRIEDVFFMDNLIIKILSIFFIYNIVFLILNLLGLTKKKFDCIYIAFTFCSSIYSVIYGFILKFFKLISSICSTINIPNLKTYHDSDGLYIEISYKAIDLVNHSKFLILEKYQKYNFSNDVCIKIDEMCKNNTSPEQIENFIINNIPSYIDLSHIGKIINSLPYSQFIIIAAAVGLGCYFPTISPMINTFFSYQFFISNQLKINEMIIKNEKLGMELDNMMNEVNILKKKLNFMEKFSKIFSSNKNNIEG